jgi:hypothetical protein|tara:strand:- start:2401 stop:2982 length:582 start_codon:yes stop_codon:yes gene_type:complete
VLFYSTTVSTTTSGTYEVLVVKKRKNFRKKKTTQEKKRQKSHLIIFIKDEKTRLHTHTHTYQVHTCLNDDFDVVGLVDIASSDGAVGANSNADDETEREGVCFRVLVVFVEEKCAEGKTAPKARGRTTGKNDVERRERAWKKNEGKEKKLRARGRRRAATTAATEFFFFFFTRRTRRNKNDGGDGDERCKKES